MRNYLGNPYVASQELSPSSHSECHFGLAFNYAFRIPHSKPRNPSILVGIAFSGGNAAAFCAIDALDFECIRAILGNAGFDIAVHPVLAARCLFAGGGAGGHASEVVFRVMGTDFSLFLAVHAEQPVGGAVEQDIALAEIARFGTGGSFETAQLALPRDRAASELAVGGAGFRNDEISLDFGTGRKL